MRNVYIENIAAHEGSEITLCGWVYNKRSSGKLQFILLRDGTGVMQCVAFRGNFTPEQFEDPRQANAGVKPGNSRQGAEGRTRAWRV